MPFASTRKKPEASSPRGTRNQRASAASTAGAIDVPSALNAAIVALVA
jgi:hypothetical protein